MIGVVFDEVCVTDLADTPVLVLREQGGARVLPVWVTAAGANAVLTALEADDPRHPSTHDLMVEALSVLDQVVEQVRITDVEDGVFTSEVVLAGSAVAARVTDAVALALRSGAPILVHPDVMARAALDGGTTGDAPFEVPEAQVEEFRAFLDTINADDFDPDAQP